MSTATNTLEFQTNNRILSPKIIKHRVIRGDQEEAFQIKKVNVKLLNQDFRDPKTLPGSRQDSVSSRNDHGGQVIFSSVSNYDNN